MPSPNLCIDLDPVPRPFPFPLVSPSCAASCEYRSSVASRLPFLRPPTMLFLNGGR